jgi:hypothetical protein
LRLARALGCSPIWLFDEDADLPVVWTDPAKTLSEIIPKLPVEKLAELTKSAERMMSGIAA